MDLVSTKCPNCGATADLDENKDFGFCKYCGSKIIKKESIIQKVKITNPIQIQGDVKIVNNEFEAKLAKVDYEAQKCLDNFSKISGIEKAKEIINSYKELEEIGGNEAKLWEHFFDFYVNVNIRKSIHIVKFKEFETVVRDIYNQIWKYESDVNIRRRYDPDISIRQFKEKYDQYMKQCIMVGIFLGFPLVAGILAYIIIGL